VPVPHARPPNGVPVNDGSKAGVLNDDRITPEISPNRDSDPSLSAAFERLPSGKQRIEFNGFVLDLQRGCVLYGDKEIALRRKPYEVLTYLVRNSGRLVPKDELMKAVWPNVIVTEDSLFQCIAELRRALDDQRQRLIKTVQRRGYRFEADLLRPPATTSPADPDIPQLPAAADQSRPKGFRRIAQVKRTVGAWTMLTVLIAIAAFSVHKWWPAANVQSASGAPVSLVVLPFRSLTNDAQSDSFAAGMTVELTTDLSRLPGAIVISPATAHAFKDAPVDTRQIGRDLNVRYIVQGTVAWSQKDVRINVQLIEAASGIHVWVDRQVREPAQVRAWQDEVVGGIANALHFKLTSLESERVLRERPHNPEAYDLTTRGWALVYSAKKPENYQNALELFREALARDPKAANAMAGVGWVAALSVLNGWSKSPEEDMAAAKRTADQLLAIDPTDVVAHHVRGAALRFEKNTEGAQAAFLAAVSINPNFANSHAQLGQTHIELGHPEEGIRSLERAMRLSPRDPNVGHWTANMGIAQLHLERYPEAVTWLRRSVDAASSSPTLRHRAYLVSALALAGRLDESRAALTELQNARSNVTIAGLQAVSRSTNPLFVKQAQCLYDGLRLAGLPE
jgi:TolB-like protein/DNA-binding winged helix-turn-helix (wHTH) protein/Tfp pilus assembly protein PilF